MLRIVDQSSSLVMEHVLTHELIHVLGLNSALRSAYDNSPLTPRKYSFFGRTESFYTNTFKCVNDKPDQTTLEIVNENTLVYKTETIKAFGGGSETRGYYEITLPTVAQVSKYSYIYIHIYSISIFLNSSFFLLRPTYHLHFYLSISFL